MLNIHNISNIREILKSNIIKYFLLNKKFTTKAFSLVEIAIVIIIISLLAGVIMQVKNSIYNSSLKAVINNLSEYRLAILQFRSFYEYFPGDFPGASDLWQSSDCLAGNAPSGCNGDGDGQIEFDTSNNDGTESARVWQHLSLAKFIKGEFKGTGARNLYMPRQVNFNLFFCARGKVSIYGLTGNILQLGDINSNGLCNNRAFLPSDAALIDQKIDDGLPYSGDFMATGSGLGCPDGATQANYIQTYKSKDCEIAYFINSNKID